MPPQTPSTTTSLTTAAQAAGGPPAGVFTTVVMISGGNTNSTPSSMSTINFVITPGDPGYSFLMTGFLIGAGLIVILLVFTWLMAVVYKRFHPDSNFGRSVEYRSSQEEVPKPPEEFLPAYTPAYTAYEMQSMQQQQSDGTTPPPSPVSRPPSNANATPVLLQDGNESSQEDSLESGRGTVLGSFGPTSTTVVGLNALAGRIAV